MQPAPIQPTRPVVPVKRRWHAPEQTHDEQKPAAPEPTPPALSDSDDEHIDEYAR